MKDKQIQINEAFFWGLFEYIYLNKQTPEKKAFLEKQFEAKFKAIADRALYTKYKTCRNEEEREQARQEYLESKGIPQGFRW